MTTATLFKKISNLEQELQELKVQAYFDMPPKEQKPFYSESSLLKAASNTRKSIWQKKYAKKVKSIS